MSLDKGEVEEVDITEVFDSFFKELESLGVPTRGRIKWIADRTGYSATQVGFILKGSRRATARFMALLRNAITEEKYRPFNEAKRNMELMFSEHDAESAARFNEGLEQINELLRLHGVNDVCIDGLRELVKMPKPLQYKAVGMLIEMNSKQEG